MSLAAVIDFLNSTPEWQAAEYAFALDPLLLAIMQIDDGRVVPWLSNGKPHPPVPMELKAARGRCAGVMEVLMKQAGYDRPSADQFVVRNVPDVALKALGATSRMPTWRTVAKWRNDVTGSTRQNFIVEQNGFRSVLDLARKNDKPWATFAKLRLARAAKFVCSVTFESTPL